MDEWLISLSGEWGPPLLELYTDNSLWINTLVALYGVLLLFSWQNLRRMRDYLRTEVARQIGKERGKVDPARLSIPWEQAMGISRFPLIASEWGFWPRPTSVANLQSLTPVEVLLPQASLTGTKSKPDRKS